MLWKVETAVCGDSTNRVVISNVVLGDVYEEILISHIIGILASVLLRPLQQIWYPIIVSLSIAGAQQDNLVRLWSFRRRSIVLLARAPLWQPTVIRKYVIFPFDRLVLFLLLPLFFLLLLLFFLFLLCLFLVLRTPTGLPFLRDDVRWGRGFCRRLRDRSGEVRGEDDVRGRATGDGAKEGVGGVEDDDDDGRESASGTC